MKKFFTLIIALTAFVMGSQTVRAEATETLEGTIKTGTVLNNPEDNNYIAYLLLLNYFHQLNMDFDEVLRVTDKKGKEFLWGFVIDGTEPEDIGNGEVILESLYYEGYYRDKEEAEENVEDNVIDKNGKILLRALLDPASLKGIKISFVCQNRFWYNFAVEALKDIEVDTYISVVLIQDYKVVSEFTLKNKKDKRPKCILGEFREQDDEDRYEWDVMDIDGKTEQIINPPLGY
jgi:hypothetical protein